MQKKNGVAGAMLWKLLERFGVQGIQFVLQIVLARMLDPDHYGTLALMVIFTALANVFIQRGFNTALIQNKEVTEDDYSSVFWVTMAVAVTLYGVLFACAPIIAAFYKMPEFAAPFRVLCLVLLPGALNSIQLAKISREMDFKQVFRSNIAAIVIAGAVGIVLAFLNAGIWALVFQSLTNMVVACVVMWFTVDWRPRFIFDLHRVKVLFSYGWKLLVSGLLDTLSQDLQSLVIGVKYNADTLGFYNRGQQFPQFLISAINSAVQSVLLPAMSAKQDDKAQVKLMMRNSVMLSSYIIFPMMAGLAAVAAPLVTLLLTDKWLPCVPYLQINCITFAFYPVHTSNLQAINAMGRSDIFLKLEMIKKTFGLGTVIIAVFCFDSPLAIAMTGVVSTVVCSLINAWPNKKLIDYSYAEQMKDILPSLAASVIMFVAVQALQGLQLGIIALLVVQVLAGVSLYLLLSVVLRLEPFRMVMAAVKNIRGK